MIERNVKERQSVKAGDVLFVLSAERMTASINGIASAQTAMLGQLRLRRESLRDELSSASTFPSDRMISKDRSDDLVALQLRAHSQNRTGLPEQD